MQRWSLTIQVHYHLFPSVDFRGRLIITVVKQLLTYMARVFNLLNAV